jgi:hypothetical protein
MKLKLVGSILLSSSILFSNSFEELGNLVDEVEVKEEKQKEFLKDIFQKRMQVQLIARDVLLVSLDFEKEKYKEEILKNAKDFDRNIEELLQKKDRNENISKHVPSYQKRILRLAKTWNEFYQNIKNFTKNSSDTEALDYIVQNNVLLLTDIDFILRKYNEFNRRGDSLVEAIKERELMLFLQIGLPRAYIHKIIKEKLLIAKEIDVISNRENLDITINAQDKLLKAFRSGNKTLGLQGTNDLKFLEKLSVVDALWKELKPLYKKEVLSEKEFTSMLEISGKFVEKHTELVKFSNQSIDN